MLAALSDQLGIRLVTVDGAPKEFRVRFRVDGVLFNQQGQPRELKAAIISRLKLMAKLNIAERRLPQDERIKIKVLGREVDLRVSTLPTLYGESVSFAYSTRSAGDFYDLHRMDGINQLHVNTQIGADVRLWVAPHRAPGPGRHYGG